MLTFRTLNLLPSGFPVKSAWHSTATASLLHGKELYRSVLPLRKSMDRVLGSVKTGKHLIDTAGVKRVRNPHEGRTKARSIYGAGVRRELLICTPT